MRRAAGLLSLLALSAAPALAGQQALVGMYPAGVAFDSGQQARVPLVFDLRAGGQLLGSYQLQVTWDPAVIRYVRTDPGEFGSPTVNASAASSGSLTLAGAAPVGRNGLFSAAQLTFEMLVSSGSSPVTVVSPELTEANTFAAIPVTPVAGGVCTSSGTYGDVNGDGSILSNDALLVVTAAVGLSIAPYTLANADVDNDGDADTRDALVILSDAVGLPTAGFRVGQAGASCAGAPAVTLALAPGSLLLATGDIAPVTASLFDSAGNPTSAQGLAWGSDAAGVATVDSGGRVTAVGNGSATITAMAIGVPSQSLSITVQDRHSWFVDAAAAASHTVHLGSPAYPFADIQTALDRAAAGDTVLVAYAAGGYGPASISKAVTVLGDSVAAGMPQLRNSAGPALVSNSPGTVTLRHLALVESNAGLDARGDTLILQWVSASSLRGAAYMVRGMRLAKLWGISVNSAELAGVFADSNGVVDINGANIRVIANRGDSAAGVAVLNGDTAVVSDVKILGVENGSAVVFSKLDQAALVQFDVRAAGGVNIDRVGFASIQLGTIQDARGAGDRPLSIHADLVLVDSVIVNGADRGVQITPMAQDTITPPGSTLNVVRSSILNVAGQDGFVSDRMDVVHVSRTTVANVEAGNGITVTRASAVRIDSSNVTGIANGTAVLIDPATSLYMHGGHLRGHEGALKTDRVQIVTLAALDVDSSAIAPQFCFLCTPHIAVWIQHADSVVLDSLNVHDNIGGGITVDSARVVAGTGTAALRNLGFAGIPSECQECGPGNQRAGAPILRSAQFTLSNIPGVILSQVQDSRLTRWTVHDNAFGGLYFTGWDALTGPTAQIVNSSFRSAIGILLSANGNSAAPSGVMTVQGGTFRGGIQAVSVGYLDQLQLSGSTVDSAGDYYAPAVLATSVRNVALVNDTVTRSRAWAVQVLSADTAQVSGSVISDGQVVDAFTQEAALEFVAVGTGVISSNRLERNAVRGIIVRNGIGSMTIDGNVVADDSGFAALQLHQAATVTHNLFLRNFNGIYVDFGGEPSQIHQNNFEGTVFSAIRNESNDITNATGNYWNAADGPQCAGAATGCTSTSGDVVYGLNFGVDFSGYLPYPDLTGAPLSVPPLRTARQRATR